MKENPYQSPGTFQVPTPKSDDRTELHGAVALIAFLAGLPVGWFALVDGSQPGPHWFFVLFCAPVYLFTGFLGAGLIYAIAMVLGTGLMCGVYSYFLVAWPLRKSSLMLFLIHAAALNLIVYLSLMKH